MNRATTRIRIRAAAVLLGMFGLALLAYTVIMTVPLVLEPDPMLGLEMLVSAVLLVAAGVAFVVGVGLTRCAAWARPTAIGMALLLILIAGALPFITPTMVGAGPPPIHPVSWLLGATGVGLLTLVVKPCRRAEGAKQPAQPRTAGVHRPPAEFGRTRSFPAGTPLQSASTRDTLWCPSIVRGQEDAAVD